MSIVVCHSILRSDHTTENTVLVATHMSLHHDHEDAFKGENSFQYGSSTTNTVTW